MGTFNSFFKSTHKQCGVGIIVITTAQLCACSQMSADIKPHFLAGPVQLNWWQSHSTQWHPSAKHDSVSVSAAAYLLSLSGFGLWLYPEDGRSQALDHPLRLLLQGQVCPRLTGYLKTGCSEPLTDGPAHPPHLIQQC